KRSGSPTTPTAGSSRTSAATTTRNVPNTRCSATSARPGLAHARPNARRRAPPGALPGRTRGTQRRPQGERRGGAVQRGRPLQARGEAHRDIEGRAPARLGARLGPPPPRRDHPDGGHRWYSVFYRPSPKRSIPVAADIRKTRLKVDLSRLPGGSRARFEVV